MDSFKHPPRRGFAMAACCGWSAASVLLLVPALAAAADEPQRAVRSSPGVIMRSDSPACGELSASQDGAACRKEAAAVKAEVRRGRLGTDEDPATLARNALRRCEAVHLEDRDACQRMARGEGDVSGSVAGGGLLKSISTTVATPPAPTVLAD